MSMSIEALPADPQVLAVAVGQREECSRMSIGSVVIVDDDVAWSQTAAGALREAGFEVFLAHDGDGGDALLARNSPTVVILDVHLPRTSGLDLLREFRKRDRLTPVLMVSGDDLAAIQDRAMAEGASTFLHKPVSLSLLLRAVRLHANNTNGPQRRNQFGGESEPR